MTRSGSIGMLFSILLASCNLVPTGNDGGAGDEAKQPPALTGWNGLTFGMRLDEALQALPNVEWNPVGLNDCYKKMVSEGCFLPSMEEGGRLPLIGGIEFRPQLQFAKSDSLESISLVHRTEGTVTSAECLDTFARAVDGMASTYAGVSHIPAPKSGRGGWSAQSKRSEGGLNIPYMAQSDGTYVSEVMRTHRPSDLPTEPTEALESWTRQSHVWALSSYIWVNGVAHCDLSVRYDQADNDRRSSRKSQAAGF